MANALMTTSAFTRHHEYWGGRRNEDLWLCYMGMARGRRLFYDTWFGVFLAVPAGNRSLDFLAHSGPLQWQDGDPTPAQMDRILDEYAFSDARECEDLVVEMDDHKGIIYAIGAGDDVCSFCPATWEARVDAGTMENAQFVPASVRPLSN